MKTNILSLLAIAGLLSFAGCANDDTANKQTEQEPGTEGLTSFVEEDNTTRTTGEYDGSGLNFYWTAGDRLWVNTGTATSPVLKQDSKNNISDLLVANPAIPTGVKRAAKASFAFAGTYTASSYPVRYTGWNNANGDKVNISAVQNQVVPNEASHIGGDGDCGVAQAQKQSDGKYHFTLDHKAAYITFLPYTTQNIVSSAKIERVRVFTGNTSDALAGTFDFADDGTLSNPTSTSNSIELRFNGYVGFSIPSTPTYTTTMVVNPGTYSNVSIEYTLFDPQTYVRGTITKTYPSITFTAGKNKKVKIDLQVKEYFTDVYYMWDAAVGQHYWKGHLDSDGKPDGNYPQNNTDPRWYREDTSLPAPAANRSTAGCPNFNECIWYVMQGDPHWDNELWTTMGHLYAGGMWFKKKANISSFNDSNYNGTDYRTTYGEFLNNSVTQGKPNNLNDYFYLPALGYYNNGTLFTIGYFGHYWSSTPDPRATHVTYQMYFNNTFARAFFDRRDMGFMLWTAQ